MITRSRPTTLNTRLKKDSVLRIRLKQVITALIVAIITLNLLVVLFNYFLTAIGKW